MNDATAGLSWEEAREERSRAGRNVLVGKQRRGGPLRTLGKAFLDPMALLLLGAGAAYWVLGDHFDASVCWAALVPVVGVEVILEGKAERALEGLAKLTSPTARVLRGGRWLELPAEDLVPGDVIELREGDVVPADAELLSGTQLTTDESSLTGESLSVEKAFREGGDGHDQAFAGTTVLAGRAVARVRQTGARTRYGQIATLVGGVGETRTPLQRSVDQLFHRLALVAVGVCIVVVLVQLAYRATVANAIVAGVSLAVAALPEEFPLVFTLFLTLGAWRLGRQRALVRKLASVETLGSVTVICTDKTGTLTLGRMEVSDVVPLFEASRDAVLEAAVCACEPEPFDPLEKAILESARGAGSDVGELHAGVLVADHPFDPKRKYMSHVWRHGGALRVFAKGSLEGILEVVHASDETRRVAHEANAQLANEGKRVIAVAAGTLPGPAVGDRAADERPLALLGLVALSDPLRPGVLESLGECRTAGIRVVMITGDHPLTAHAVANGLALPHDDADPVLTGDAFDRLDEGELRDRASRMSIFSRMRPEQKHRLVEALKRAGETVAMTGDGINDAPALRSADIGIAMGKRGTAVAREAADIVLMDDNFATIVHAVREGRRIYDNLRKSFGYLLAFHVPIVVLALVIPLLGLPLLLLPIELVFLELVLHPTVAVVFEGEPAEAGVMSRPPRSRGQALMTAREAVRPLVRGVALTAVTLVLYLYLLRRGPVEVARGAAFACLIAGQAFLVLTQRSLHVPFWRASYRGQRTLLPVLALTAIALAVILYVPPVAEAFHLAPPPPLALLIALVIGAASTVWPTG